jgi:hypothetical protein
MAPLRVACSRARGASASSFRFAAAASLLAVTAVAVFLLTLRATRVQPMEALRHEESLLGFNPDEMRKV